MKQRPILFSSPMVKAILAGLKTQTRREIKPQPGNAPTDDGFETTILKRCPFGKAGDILWVREKHQVHKVLNDYIVTYSDGTTATFYYKELSLNTIKRLNNRKSLNSNKWVTARFMPKQFSRIWLLQQHINIEPLQAITTPDIKSEGLRLEGKFAPEDEPLLLRSAWQHLWTTINGQESWAENPYVWAIKFKVLSTTGKPKTLPGE